MAKYTYTPLKAVLTSNSKFNNIYGVIRKYHEQGVYIRDETYDAIKVNFSTTFDEIFPHIKPGNIIRIHRLMTTGNQVYRCIKSGDILLFSSFKDKDAESYKVRFEAKEPTIEQSDFTRVIELESWLAGKILEVSLENISMPGWVDMVCKVIDIKDIASHRVILIVADGTKPFLKYNWFSPNCEHYDGIPMDQLVCITAWDRHAEKARKLERGSFIAIFNLQIAEAKIQSGFYELHLRGGTHYGKRIRNVNSNSILGVSFQERLNISHPVASNNPINVPNTQPKTQSNTQANVQFNTQSNTQSISRINAQSNTQPNVHSNTHSNVQTIAKPVAQSSTQSNIQSNTPNVQPKLTTVIEKIQESCSSISPSHSTQIVSDADPAISLCEISDIGSSFLNDHDPSTHSTSDDSDHSKPLPSKRMKLSCPVKFPACVQFKNPEGLFGIKEYLAFDSDERYCVKAKVKRYLPSSRKVIDFIKLVCPNCNYKESASTEAINKIKASSELQTSFPCPDCRYKNEKSQLVATFWINLSLKDTESYEIAVSLTKLDFRCLLGVRVISVLNSIEEANKIFDFLDYVCPSIDNDEASGSKEQDNRPFLKWVIQRQPGEPGIKYEYSVLTAYRLDGE